MLLYFYNKGRTRPSSLACECITYLGLIKVLFIYKKINTQEKALSLKKKPVQSALRWSTKMNMIRRIWLRWVLRYLISGLTERLLRAVQIRRWKEIS